MLCYRRKSKAKLTECNQSLPYEAFETVIFCMSPTSTLKPIKSKNLAAIPDHFQHLLQHMVIKSTQLFLAPVP